MPTMIVISTETNDGARCDRHTIAVPDWPPDLGQGSRLRAERLAAIAAAAIAEGLADDNGLREPGL